MSFADEPIDGVRSDEPFPIDARAALDDAWYAVWTHSHCEHLVKQQLLAKGFLAFLPEMQTWSKRTGVMHLIRTPMFPGYLFVRDALDKSRYIDLLKVRGIVRILEDGWSRLTPIPDGEIETIQRIVDADVPVLPHVHLHTGDRVRVREGPLAGMEGVFVHDKPTKGRLVVSVTLLSRSVAVEMDCTAVEPCSSGSGPTRHANDKGDHRAHNSCR